MQKSIRVNEAQLLYLASKAKMDCTLSGLLWKRRDDTGKWQLRWFALYQNLLFYYENDSCAKPSGVALLEGSYCERIVATGSGSAGKSRSDVDKQVLRPCMRLFLQKMKKIMSCVQDHCWRRNCEFLQNSRSLGPITQHTSDLVG